MSIAAKIVAPDQGESPSDGWGETFVGQAGDPVGQLQQMLADRMATLRIEDCVAPVDRLEAIISGLSRFAAFPAILIAGAGIIQGIRSVF